MCLDHHVRTWGVLWSGHVTPCLVSNWRGLCHVFSVRGPALGCQARSHRVAHRLGPCPGTRASLGTGPDRLRGFAASQNPLFNQSSSSVETLAHGKAIYYFNHLTGWVSGPVPFDADIKIEWVDSRQWIAIVACGLPISVPRPQLQVPLCADL
jgi:hypothetical protein